MDDLTGSGLAVSISTVKLEGTGEGMLAELAEDMLQGNGWLLCFAFAFGFYVFPPP